MLKKLKLEEFYTEENKKIDSGMGIGAVGLLTPNQFIRVFNYEVNGIDGLGTHDGTYMFLLNDIYGLNAPINKKGFPDKAFVLRRIPNGKSNYVFMDFIVQDGLDSVTVNIPKYITPYQYNELESLNEELKNHNIAIELLINQYDPRKTNYSNSSNNEYYTGENSIDLALQYMKNNNRVLDYNLPFGEEKILEIKKNHI